MWFACVVTTCCCCRKNCYCFIAYYCFFADCVVAASPPSGGVDWRRGGLVLNQVSFVVRRTSTSYYYYQQHPSRESSKAQLTKSNIHIKMQQYQRRSWAGFALFRPFLSLLLTPPAKCHKKVIVKSQKTKERKVKSVIPCKGPYRYLRHWWNM